ncbi:hypothetical protein HanXRQr2_MTg0835311 (mitochondrion) [Helianthus annuus]|uniref:Uncharacterized protein n=1 Tax=Helianthus annuus TaxID=4232 RepID=A0A9K3DCZ0_HELAN|nr:hypothetical protein HanXRQr2_MTg0835311 [Helianthus annuus]KAJ0959586.1 hypothetical protein HanPSC8_Chr00c021g0802461 [Helianthus annuus]
MEFPGRIRSRESLCLASKRIRKSAKPKLVEHCFEGDLQGPYLFNLIFFTLLL